MAIAALPEGYDLRSVYYGVYNVYRSACVHVFIMMSLLLYFLVSCAMPRLRRKKTCLWLFTSLPL